MVVALVGAACGQQNTAVRSSGHGSPTEATSTTPAGFTTGEPLTTTIAAPTTISPPRTISSPKTGPTQTTAVRPVVTTAPVTTVVPGAGSGVKGAVVFGPVCPVERVPPDPLCAPRPGAAEIEIVKPDGGVAARVSAGSDGTFAIAVAPGRYAVKATAAAPGPGRGCQTEPPAVTVVPGSFTPVAVTCDTGIR